MTHEKARLLELVKYEHEALSRGFKTIAGIDEAGRGPLAGPVVASACIIPDGLFFEGVNDSKQLTPQKREKLFHAITSHPDVIYGIGLISSSEIDRINILQATMLAMLQAVDNLKVRPDYLLVDGLKLPHQSIPSLKIIKGDTLSQSIAAASIIAKVTRDEMMLSYDARWPVYGFKSHKGYGTAAHIEAINKHGPCEIHRLSFAKVVSTPCK